jgi:prevent-host-death family protein
MKTVTTHEAKTHLSRLLKEVQRGEEIIILNGTIPAARLTGVEAPPSRRPQVGTPTSEPVRYDPDAFRPLSDEELAEWSV